jgi:CTP:molybdopterin cytidylyltransferase MocA
MAPATAALILSAGASSRLGGEPKALLPVEGRSGLRRIAEICLGAGFGPVAVVVGPHRGPVAHELRGLEVELVDSEQWSEGSTASVQAGLASLPPDRDVLFWPVDRPFVRPRTVDALLAARDTDLLGVWFIPTFEGRGGHPVLWRPAVRNDIFDLRPDAPLRALLPEFGPQVRRVAVDDPGVLADVDTVDAFHAATWGWMAPEAL